MAEDDDNGRALLGYGDAVGIRRPALDAALATLEAQAATGICPVCKRDDHRTVKFGGCAFFDYRTGKMTPWMCPRCAADYCDKHGIRSP